MASAKSILERMIAAMNRGETVLQRDIDVFAKPHPKEETRRKEEPSSSARNSQLQGEEKATEEALTNADVTATSATSDSPAGLLLTKARLAR